MAALTAKKRPAKSIDVLNDLLVPLVDCSTPASARKVLRFKLTDSLRQRVVELGERHSEGLLTEAERNEYESFVRFNTNLAILKAKAKAVLSRQKS